MVLATTAIVVGTLATVHGPAPKTIKVATTPQTAGSSLDGWQPPPDSLPVKVVTLRSDGHTSPSDKSRPRVVVAIPVDKEIEKILEPKVHSIEVSIGEQRLYVRDKRGQVLRTFAISTAATGITYAKDCETEMAEVHNHNGDFTIDAKDVDHISGIYGSPMLYALHYFKGHWIHATEPRFYGLLGQPASNGCVRRSAADARWLYTHTPVGVSLTID